MQWANQILDCSSELDGNSSKELIGSPKITTYGESSHAWAPKGIFFPKNLKKIPSVN